MANKWTVYAATYLTYSVVHAIRTCWASMKTIMIDEPYDFSQKFLGALDMTVLFTIAILLNIFGGQVEKHSRRKLLFIMMIGLIINLLLLYVLLLQEVRSKGAYFFLYGTTGILSCLAWPICLYTVSQYFDSKQAIALSMWSSVSQSGDFIAFAITLIVISSQSIHTAYSMLLLAIVFIIVLVYDYFFFQEKDNQLVTHTIQGQIPQQQIQNKTQEQENNPKIQGSNEVDKNIFIELPPQTPQSDLHVEIPQKPVTFLTVWLLPGVALPVLSFSMVKSINAIIISWLVLYFNKIEMVKQSRVIAIAWACSIVLGGYIGAKINRALSYRIFSACLFVAGFIFYLLQQFHVHPNSIEIILLMIICGILVGGPYNQLGSAVPLKLSQDPQIRNKPKAKSTIISVMQSFGQFICGISILIVPSIGIIRLHYMAGSLCFISVAMLIGQQIRQNFTKPPVLIQAKSQHNNAAAPPPIELKEQA